MHPTALTKIIATEQSRDRIAAAARSIAAASDAGSRADDESARAGTGRGRFARAVRPRALRTG